MTAWPSFREQRRTSRYLPAVAYLATTGTGATALASLAAWPFHGQTAGFVFVEVGLAAAQLAGALTPRHCFPTRTPRKDCQ